MRILAMVLVLELVLLLTACGLPAGSVRATSMRVQLAAIPVAGPVNPDPRVGPIFLEGDTLHICTGSVVHSSTGDLILTAAHCLAEGFTATFVPGFANAAAPSNVWTIDAVYLDPLWVDSQDPQVDYAFARVSRPGGGSIEAQVGSALWLGRAPPKSASSAMRPVSGARQSAAKTVRGSPMVTPRFRVRTWSSAPAARRGSGSRRSPG
jgi:Trypsin